MNENEMLPDDEISLYDLVSPLIEAWKTIVIATLLGVLAGTAVWLLKGYEAELKAKPVAKLDFVEWRRISSGLPALADFRARKPESEDGGDKFYSTLSKSEWWLKNVTIHYRYSKTDLKEFGALSKDELENATRIETVIFRGNGGASSEAVANAAKAERFAREGGLLLALKSSVERWDLSWRRVTAEVQAKISRHEVELGYLQKRAVAQKKLAQQFPDRQQNALQSVFDPKEESARYLPLNTQLIAIETEINELEEQLNRSRDRLDEARVVKAFATRAVQLIKADPTGFKLAEDLELLEADIRKGIDPANKAQIASINDIGREVNDAHERFKSLFEANTLVSVQRASRLSLALGLVGGGLFGVLFVFVRTAWRRARRSNTANGAA